MTRRTLTRPVAALAAATAVAFVLIVAWAPAATAASYRYWSFWHGTASGSWSFSPVGAGYVPPNGSVEGWRFAVSAVAGSVSPRSGASFASICSGHTAGAGGKLVGLVVDYGTAADAPPGQHPPRGVDTYCAAVPASYTSGQVLAAYAPVTDDAGLVCSIDGYPRNECGVVVHPSPTPTTRPTHVSPGPTHSGTSAHSPSPAGTSSGGAGGVATTPAPNTPGAVAVQRATGPPSAVGTGAATAPPAIAVGGGGVHPPDDSGGGPPVGAIAAGALVVIVGGAALLRSGRPARHADGPTR